MVVGAGCSGKTIQYPEDHDRYLRIDKAVESLRQAYVSKDVVPVWPRSWCRWMATDRLQQEAESDFETFHDIVMDFRVERIMIEGTTSMCMCIGPDCGKKIRRIPACVTAAIRA